ncbi:ABC transporter ATP-binding protein [Clostridium botulinum]|uniref:ABC transporter ATP-binding protein n=1 Tax=Clostridium botulinum TaxID=1491 RepID=UPI00388DAF27
MKKKCLLSTHNLTKEYKNKKAVNDLNITVYEGDVYGFLGPNGAGKSTTIKSIMGLIKPTSGKVIINRYDVEKDSEKAIEKIGTMVEAPSFYGGLSGYKNLILMANLYGVPKKRVDEVLEMVRLTDSAHKNVSKYSLGMKQRLGIARAFLNNPNIVILDEPTNGLDPQGIKDIRELIQDLSKKYHVTFLISSHILSEIQAVCNRIGIIEKGSLKIEGYVEDLLNTDEELIEIYTREKEKTSRLLKNMNTSSKIECFEGGIRIKIKKGNFQNVNKILISNGVNIENIYCKKNSLEDYFFNVMEGDNEYA